MDQQPTTERNASADLAEMAVQELNRGHYEGVAEALDRAVLLDPSSDTLAKALKQVFQRVSRTGHERLLDALLHHPSVGLRLALVAVDEGDLDRALEWCTILARRQYPDALILESLILEIRGDLKGALRAADEFVALHADSPNGYLRRAAIHSTIGGNTKMKGNADAARVAYQQALVDYDKSLELAPDLVDALLSRARVLAKMDEVDAALDAYSKALARDQSLVDAYAERGLLYEASGRSQDALADYDAMVRLAPDNALAYQSRAAVHAVLGHRDRALADYDQALKLMPNLPQAWLARAQLHAAEGRLDLALREYDHVLKDDPGHVVAHGLRGDVLVALGDTADPDTPPGPTEYYERALRDYDVVVRSVPDVAQGYVRRGEVRTRLDDDQQALEDFDAAIRLDATHVEAHLRRGDALIVLGDNFRALSSYKQAGRLDVRNPNAQLGRAAAYLGLGDSYRDRRSFDDMYEAYDAAIQAGQRALQLALQADGEAFGDDIALAHSHHGRALRGLWDYDTAIAAFERAEAAAAQPTFKAAMLAEQGETLRLWGVLVEEPSKLQTAVGLLERALAGRPERADLAWIEETRGSVLVELDRYDEALQAFDAALNADDRYGWAHIGRGKTHYLRQEFADAMSSFERLSSREAGRDFYGAWADVGQGLVLLRMGRDAEANRALERALGTSRPPNCYLDRADMLESFNALQLAEQDRQTAVSKRPASADALNALAWTYLQYQPTPDRLRAAIELAQKALDLSRTGWMRAAYLDSVAWAHHKLGDDDRAVRLLEQATLLDPHHVLIRMHLHDARAVLHGRAP